MKKGLFVLGILVLLVGTAFSASAVDQRTSATVDLICGGSNIVSRGTRAIEVLMKCGEPMRKEIHNSRQIEGQSTTQYGEQGQVSRDSATETVDTYEIWFYNPGQNYYVYAVEIFNNIVTAIHITSIPGSGLPDWERKK